MIYFFSNLCYNIIRREVIKLNDTQKSSYNQDWTEQEGSRGGNKEQKEQQKQKDKNLFEQIIAESENDLKNG